MRSNLIVYSFFLLNIFSSTLFADAITVHNQTDKKIYVALYKQKSLLRKSEAKKVTSPVVAIESNKDSQLERPKREIGFDRELAFSYQENDLKDLLSVSEFNLSEHTNVGDTQGSEFYIAEKEGRLFGYNAAEWKISEPLLQKVSKAKQQVIKTITDPIKDLIKAQYKVIKENPYKDTVAQIRVGNELVTQERAYLQKREAKVKAGLEKFLGRAIEAKKMPVIAFVESGGGYRAMTCSIGWHLGALKTGLMDTITYMVGLSGSTWSIGLWLASGLGLEEFAAQLTPLMKLGVEVNPQEFVLIADNLLVKAAFNQEVTLVDLFGGVLANTLLKNFGDKRQQVRISDQAKNIENADIPFPIYTAVRGDDKAKQQWYEFTPYEVGASWLGCYVPTWAYGRKFDNGKSVDFAPEQSFGFLMGTWGSAFAAKVEQMLAELKKDEESLKPPFDTILDGMLDRVGHERLTSARIFNFTAGMSNSPLKNSPQLNLVDGGTAFNLPYPPISGERAERKADIIIFLDASGGTLGNDLRKVEQYAKDNKLKLPKFDYTILAKKAVSIFKDENDDSVPLVIYLGRVRDDGLIAQEKANPTFKDFIAAIQGFDVDACIAKEYCSTFNFKYEPQEFKQLSGLTEFNMRASIEIIKQAIDWKVKQLSGDAQTSSPKKDNKPDVPAQLAMAQAQPAKPQTQTPNITAQSTSPAVGSNAGDGYIWNNPPNWQVKCTDGAQYVEKEGGCRCIDATKKLKKVDETKDTSTNATRSHWVCE